MFVARRSDPAISNGLTSRDLREGAKINRKIQRISGVAVQYKEGNLMPLRIMHRGRDDPIDLPCSLRFELPGFNLDLEDSCRARVEPPI